MGAPAGGSSTFYPPGAPQLSELSVEWPAFKARVFQLLARPSSARTRASGSQEGPRAISTWLRLLELPLLSLMASLPPEACECPSTFCPWPDISHLKAPLSSFSRTGQPGPTRPTGTGFSMCSGTGLRSRCPVKPTPAQLGLNEGETEGRKERREKAGRGETVESKFFNEMESQLWEGFLLLPPAVSQTYS